ncbi:MAG: tol-pal system-associated acyl-CoA thioesterase [Legionella longbeachae]|nr:tol-pal system-associated acyl-CoA thioesterase [Legionella longbeachae]
MDVTITYQQRFRVYAEDVDFMGIVYHANYLCYFERARTEMLRQNNFTLSDLMKQNILFAVHDMHIRYKAPARLDDLLTIKTQVQQQGACSFIFDQIMQNEQDRLISEAKVQVVCVDGNLKPRRFPH